MSNSPTPNQGRADGSPPPLPVPPFPAARDEDITVNKDDNGNAIEIIVCVPDDPSRAQTCDAFASNTLCGQDSELGHVVQLKLHNGAFWGTLPRLCTKEGDPEEWLLPKLERLELIDVDFTEGLKDKLERLSELKTRKEEKKLEVVSMGFRGPDTWGGKTKREHLANVGVVLKEAQTLQQTGRQEVVMLP